MKKIIAAVDALNFTENELRSYRYIADKARGHLTILFLENIAGESILQTTTLETGYLNYSDLYAESVKIRQEKAEENRKHLVNFYRDNCMDVTVRPLPGVPATEVLAESRFADLLLVRNNTSFATINDTNPPVFIKDMLADAECPVMILPETVHYFKEIVFTYNGTASSTYAIRQFTQIFDGLSEVPVKVLYVQEKDNKALPSGKLIKEYLTRHYEEVVFESLEGTPSAELLAQTMHRTSCVITFGAYGRSRTSRFFHRSGSDSILRTANVPLFITHF
jgi:nucleotide-binding universal stress UspA family protein